MDDLTKRGPQDAARININEDHEVRYWCGKFSCTVAVLRGAIEAVGPMVKDVEAYFAD